MNYPGGKNASGVYHTIINQMPPHDTYIEPFVGSGAVLRMKRPARYSIAVDRDAAAVQDLIAEIGDTGSGLASSGEAAGAAVNHGDGISFLQKRRWAGNELVYCDPPYLLSTRTSGPMYRYELTERDHVELLGTLKTLPAMVVLSGYESPLYLEMLEGWRLVQFTAMTRGGGPRTECLWMNFPEPTALHDYRFVGKNFRERERLKRRAQRWAAKFRQMSSMERTVISGALANAADERSVLAGPGGIADRGDAGSGIAVQCDGIPPPKVTSGAAAGR